MVKILFRIIFGFLKAASVLMISGVVNHEYMDCELNFLEGFVGLLRLDQL
jgi:hypothetical protein